MKKKEEEERVALEDEGPSHRLRTTNTVLIMEIPKRFFADHHTNLILRQPYIWFSLYFSYLLYFILAAEIALFRRSVSDASSNPNNNNNSIAILESTSSAFWQPSTGISASTSIIPTLGGMLGAPPTPVNGLFDDSGCGVSTDGSSMESLNGGCDKLIGGRDSLLKSKRMSICSSCGQQITDRFILRVYPNLEFHADCLKCSDCNRILDENCTAFVRNGKTFCKDDYLKLFGQKCYRCGRQFQRNDLVMRARNLVYHMHCFSCHSCNKQLAPGEHFVIRDNELYCRSDCLLRPSSVKTVKEDEEWDSVVGCSEKDACCPLSPAASPALSNKSPSTTSDEQSMSMSSLQQPTVPQTPSTSIPPSMGNGLVHFGQRHTNSGSTSSSSNGSTICSGGIKKKKDKPSTRVRTVLTENQLRILKQMYATNTRPDAMTKEQLSEMTSLNARVIRVWFQNKRCKDKKRQNALREQQKVMEKEQALHGVRINGIGPMIAASPTSLQDQAMNMGPIEIHQFPQNPALWATNCMDATGHLQRGPSMDVLQPPPPYQSPNVMMQGPHPGGFSDLSGPMDLPNAYALLNHQPFGIPHALQLDPSRFSPQLGASSLSSPSCSD